MLKGWAYCYASYEWLNGWAYFYASYEWLNGTPFFYLRLGRGGEEDLGVPPDGNNMVNDRKRVAGEERREHVDGEEGEPVGADEALHARCRAARLGPREGGHGCEERGRDGICVAARCGLAIGT